MVTQDLLDSCHWTAKKPLHSLQDPEETDALAGLKNFGKKFLNFSGKEPESQQGKPIIWASEWEKRNNNKK
jgi:hypothetical protein